MEYYVKLAKMFFAKYLTCFYQLYIITYSALPVPPFLLVITIVLPIQFSFPSFFVVAGFFSVNETSAFLTLKNDLEIALEKSENKER